LMPSGTIASAYVSDPERIAKLTSLAQYVSATFDGSADSLLAIKDKGGSIADLAAATGYLQKDIAALYKNIGIPAFAKG
ncbi:hypothetical protein ACI3PL_31605, partial [Lacticaseibacillus paracasei]